MSDLRPLDLKSESAKSVGYWEHRYRVGRDSGKGSIGAARDWKWSIIEAHGGSTAEVLDVGCGDLRFWGDRGCPDYLGLDVSWSVLRRNRERRPSWQFIRVPASARLRVRRRVVLCFDLLFHIMDEAEYDSIIDNLIAYTEEWLFIHTWSRNPFVSLRRRAWLALSPHEEAGSRALRLLRFPFRFARILRRPPPTSDGEYETFRPLEKDLPRFEAGGLHLEGIVPSPVPPRVGGLYVFRRVAR